MKIRRLRFAPSVLCLPATGQMQATGTPTKKFRLKVELARYRATELDQLSNGQMTID